MAAKLPDLVERIRLRLEESFVGIGADVAELSPPDLAELLNQLTRQEAGTVLSMLPVARAAEVLNESTLSRRSAIVEELDPGRGAALLDALSSDQRADVVRGMGDTARRRLLPRLPDAVRTEVESLLRYPPHTAGGIMTTEFVRLSPQLTVGEALKHIRAVASEKESIYACYVLE